VPSYHPVKNMEGFSSVSFRLLRHTDSALNVSDFIEGEDFISTVYPHPCTLELNKAVETKVEAAFCAH